MQEDGQEFIVNAGQTLILHPGCKHGGIAQYPDDLQFYWVHFIISDSTDNDNYEIPQTTTSNRPDYLTMLFRMFLENQESFPDSTISGDLLMLLILTEVAHFSKANNVSISQTKLRLVSRTDSFVRLHFDKAINTSSIAYALDINPDYLGRTYHIVTGKTITEAIHTSRIKKAKTLLMETDYPIDRISFACGFETVGFFRRIFNRYEGMSPAKYRQLYCRVHVNTE
jgi:YesN/AraC family two-component response regulator